MNGVIENLQQIRRFTGHPGEFWPLFLELSTRLANARAGLLLIQGKEPGTWKQLSIWPANEDTLKSISTLTPLIEQAADASLESPSAWDCKRSNGSAKKETALLGVRLEAEKGERPYVIVFLLDQKPLESIEQTAQSLKLISDTPAVYGRFRAEHQAERGTVHLAEALDLMVLLNGEKRYMSTAMCLVNETASRYNCQRVSLGWIESEYVRLQAISHMEKFEKKMDIVQSLEAAMEEAFDQNEEILLPSPSENTTVTRDHEAFSKEQETGFMVSLPIRLDDLTVGVLTCERKEIPFSDLDVRGLRILCDQAARRLDDLKKSDKWIGARLADKARTAASRLFGVEHTLAKCVSLLVCSLLFFLLFGTLEYRVEAPFILRSDDVRYLPAPFEGYIEDVFVKVGEKVNEGDLLLTFDTGDLLLEESAAIGNRHRYTREAEKARAENTLAEMNIALAMAEQAQARLDLARYHLKRAELKAPFSGIVVEGDLEKMLGASVKKGDVLLKVSRIETMYTELEVNERDIHELAEGATGEIAFISQPQLSFPITIERIEPVALAKKETGNVFLVRGLSSEGLAEWWRPGMSGVSKINAGKRNIFWILTHRTADFIRMRLWW